MTTRRDFLGRLALGAAGLWLAPDALELITEPRRKYWAGHDFKHPPIAQVWRKVHRDLAEGMQFEVREWRHFESIPVKYRRTV